MLKTFRDKKMHGVKVRPSVVGALIVLATMAVYLPAGLLDFIYFDDPEYVTENWQVSRGVTWSGVVWAFTHFHASNWHPLTWISHMIDCNLYGLWPGGHHLTNVVFHAVNSMLLWSLLHRLTRSVWRSACVAAFFALHPLHVESVAWISERKDVLSTLFGFLCLHTYAVYVRLKDESPGSQDHVEVKRRALVWLCLSLGLFTFSLMSKPMLVTLPCLMLLLDFWPLERLGSTLVPIRARAMLPLIIEKLPFCGLATGSCLITFLAQKAGGAVAPLGNLPLDARFSNALVSNVRYVGKLFWPANQAALYPFETWPFYVVVPALVMLCGITGLAVWQRHVRPYFAVGWLWYLVSLVPVIGIVQVGVQSIADRYTYIPSIGIFVMMVWGVGELAGAARTRRVLAASVAVLAIIACALLTQVQINYWYNTETVFRRAIAVTSRNAVAYSTIARYLTTLHDWRSAGVCCRAALEIDPRFEQAWNNLGCVLTDQGKPAEAVQACRTAVRLSPSFSEAHNNLGTALLNSGNADQAISHYSEALRLKPDYHQAHYNLANALASRGEVSGARKHYEISLGLNPRFANAHNNLAFMLVVEGALDRAVAEFRTALALDPRLWQARFGLGDALEKGGDNSAAGIEFGKVLEFRPHDAAILTRLGICQQKCGNHNEAIRTFSRVLELRPGDPSAQEHLDKSLEARPKGSS